MKLGVSQGVCRGSETSPMMGSTPYRVAARRTCPSSVASFRERATHAPADSRESVQNDTAVNYILVWDSAQEPQSGFPDGEGGRGRGAGGGWRLWEGLGFSPRTGSCSALWSGISKRPASFLWKSGVGLWRRSLSRSRCSRCLTWKPGHYSYKLLVWQTPALVSCDSLRKFWKNFLSCPT